MELTETLKALQVDRQLEAVTRGWDTLPAWVFCNDTGHCFITTQFELPSMTSSEGPSPTSALS